MELIFVSPVEFNRIYSALNHGCSCVFTGVAVDGQELFVSDHHEINRDVLHHVVLNVEWQGKTKYDRWDYKYEVSAHRKTRKVALWQDLFVTCLIIESLRLESWRLAR